MDFFKYFVLSIDNSIKFLLAINRLLQAAKRCKCVHEERFKIRPILHTKFSQAVKMHWKPNRKAKIRLTAVVLILCSNFFFSRIIETM